MHPALQRPPWRARAPALLSVASGPFTGLPLCGSREDLRACGASPAGWRPRAESLRAGTAARRLSSPATAGTHEGAVVGLGALWGGRHPSPTGLVACRLQENSAILKELVALRAQKSSLLGFSTHADYVLEMSMAKTSQAVATFLGDQPPSVSRGAPGAIMGVLDHDRLVPLGTLLCPSRGGRPVAAPGPSVGPRDLI